MYRGEALMKTFRGCSTNFDQCAFTIYLVKTTQIEIKIPKLVRKKYIYIIVIPKFDTNCDWFWLWLMKSSRESCYSLVSLGAGNKRLSTRMGVGGHQCSDVTTMYKKKIYIRDHQWNKMQIESKTHRSSESCFKSCYFQREQFCTLTTPSSLHTEHAIVWSATCYI